MNAFVQMVIANLKMTVRNRVALFWNLAFPLIFILLFGFLFSGDDVTIDVGVVNTDASPVAQQVTDEMQKVDGFKVTTGTQDQELGKLKDGDRTVVLVFAPGDAGSQANATLYWDASNPQIGQVAISAVQNFLNQANLAITGGPPPVAVKVESVTTTNLDYMDYLIPGILAMTIMNSGMIGLSSAFVSYREKGILRRIKATPFPLSSFILARIVSQLVISVLQAVILIGVGILVVGLDLNGSILNIFVMVTLGSLAFLSLGFVIASFARNQEAADSLSNAVSFPMLFLGGVFFPVDSAPKVLQPIMRLIPLRYLADGLRNLMVRDATLPGQWLNIAIMLATAAIGLALALRLFRWESSTA
jgi:ABC-2 type transport system permease protein